MNDPSMPRHGGPPHHPKIRSLIRRQRETSINPTQQELRSGFRGWNERGYLPHRDEPGLTQFITFRLADSFPSDLHEQWQALWKLDDDRERRLRVETWLDLGCGECHLKNEHVAALVFKALRRFDGERYHLLAFTIMPNHVHVLMKVLSTPVSRVVQSWKRFTANQANIVLNRRGRFWQEDYWDTYMRDVEHEKRTIRYIRNNPAKAGLVSGWKAWPWTYLASEE